ncbi:MAG: ECF transporter S component [Firmicutes bacterium]|nr:ECF transporter S component [Bacillota bacterium]
MKRVEKTDNLVMTAMMLCLVCLATYALKVPNPFTQGYVHLGDTFIFISVLTLGKKNGAIASAIGAALADIIGGYAIFAIGTFIAKGLMAYVMGTFIELGAKKTAESGKNTLILSHSPYELLAMILGGLTEVVIYVFVNAAVYGNFTVGLLSIPGNIGQFVCSMVVAVFLVHALLKTPVKRYLTFAHR